MINVLSHAKQQARSETIVLSNTKAMYRRDPRFKQNPSESSSKEAYTKFRYTKGHLAAAGKIFATVQSISIIYYFITGNHIRDEAHLVEIINTYILTNMAPQYSLHNNVAWKKWEEYTREKAMNEVEGPLFVITGVTGDKKLVQLINTSLCVTYMLH